jgi:transcriptional regulator with XRE-family HTH domain
MSRKLLADKIRQLREERSWSQAQLGGIANVSLRTIQRVEKDGHCSHETLLSIAAAFDIDVRQLTGLIKNFNDLEESNLRKYQYLDYSDFKRKISMTISKHGFIILSSGVFYLICLFALVAFTASNFHTVYQVLNPEIEAQLNLGYRQFLGFMGLGLALYLGIWSGFFGIWRKKIWQGLLLLFLEQ